MLFVFVSECGKIMLFQQKKFLVNLQLINVIKIVLKKKIKYGIIFSAFFVFMFY